MAQTVDKLKELLFDSEARALETLGQRVGSIEKSAQTHETQHVELAKQVDVLLERAGTTERFEISVAGVIDGALRKAEVERHTALASAIAPLVVRTVKTEIRNSRDELVEALYPMTGRMVQAYVASAMKDLANDINRRLEQNAFMLRLRSLASGKSVAEIAMAESQNLQVEELYLIRRGSGELVGRWPEPAPGSGNRDHVMSGVLTAINEFSSQALSSDGAALRQIDLGERQLYLRVSPLFLLAAKCTGTAQPPVEAVLDQAFLGAIERLHDAPASGNGANEARSDILKSLSSGIETEINAKTGEMAAEASGLSPLKVLAYIIGVPLLGWMSWSILGNYQTERIRTLATRVTTSIPEIAGYPLSLDIGSRGQSISVSGLVPSPTAKSELIERLQRVSPGTAVIEQLSVLPNDLATVEPRIAGVNRNVQELTPEVAKVRKDIATLQTNVSDQSARDLEEAKRLASENAKLAAEAAKLRDQLSAETARLRDDVAALKAKPAPKLELPPVTDRDRLIAFTRATAVFFENDTDFKDKTQATKDLDQLASLLQDNTLLVRVVGYTDNQGTPAANASLSEARAKAVVDQLLERGIARNRIVALGRVDLIGISPDRGPTSPNRRVEFEVGFEGEGR